MDEGLTRISLVLIPKFNMLAVTALIEPMRVANYLSAEPLYAWTFTSAEGGPQPASNGMSVDCRPLRDAEADKPDIIAVFGSWGAEHYDRRDLSAWLRQQSRAGRTLIGGELGIYALARAKLLGDREVTTHWSWKPGFVEAFPDIRVVEQLYTVDRKIMTCAGGTGAIDLMLRIIAERHGEQLVAEIAGQLLHHPLRPPETPQRLAGSGIDPTMHPAVRSAIAAIEARVEEPVSVPALCRELGLSQRQLERLFKRYVGCTIVQYSRLVRLQHARVLLISTELSIRDVSAACGFNSLSYFSTCFVETFGRKPSEYRHGWPEGDPAPRWPGNVYAFSRAMDDGRQEPDPRGGAVESVRSGRGPRRRH